MAKINHTCGIDIGTHTTRVVVVGFPKGSTDFEILATGSAETEGMRLGYIHNIDHVAASITHAVRAEKMLGSKIRRAYVSIGGISLTSSVTTGETVISRADQEITHLDISKSIADSEANLDATNKKIIHIIPLGYKLDGKDIHGRPEGMKGIKLEVRTLFITSLKQHLEDLATALSLAGIEVEDIIAAPVAESMILLSQKEKAAGCALVNIGAETVSLAVFENSLLISLHIFSIGSMDITKDIALGFRIALTEAEGLKMGKAAAGNYPKKKVEEIIEARFGDIFELVGNHLKRLKRNELLPAGIVLSGGGAHVGRVEEIAKSQLKLPCRIGPADPSIHARLKIRDASWYTAYGLAFSAESDSTYRDIHASIGDNVKQVKGFFKSMLSQLLP